MKALFVILVCILYVLLPLDVLPDFIPLLGRFDDLLAVVVTAIFMYRRRRSSAPPPAGASPAPEAIAPKEPHEILGVSRRAGPDEIRQAYRALIAQYHPDKVAHLGPELRETAHRKTLEIQRAYEALVPEG